MKIEIKGLDKLSRQQAEEILFRIFSTCEQGFIKQQLALRKIEMRTRIYHAFQHAYFYNKNILKMPRENNEWYREQPQQAQDQRECIGIVLDQSNIKDWVEAYSQIVPIKTVINKVAPSMGNRLELVAILDGMQTN